MSALKKIYGDISKTEELDDGTLKVWGVASTEMKDSDGEIITAEAMKAALSGYMKFGAVREMHQPKAAGTALEINVRDDNGVTEFCAHIVDSEAVKKVRANVYKGFSIGGNVLKRDDLNKTIITGLNLVEVSLVDRPANPEAVITMYKADTMEPKQIWACGNPAHQHMAKADAVSCIECGDNVEKSDGTETTETAESAEPQNADQRPDVVGAEAEAEKADGAEDLKKSMWSVSRFADLLGCIGSVAQDAKWEAEYEGDNSPIPAQLREWLKSGADILSAMAVEEVAELIASLTPPADESIIALADGADDLQKAGARFSKATKTALSDLHAAVKVACDTLDKMGYADAEEAEEESEKSAGADDLQKVQIAHDEVLQKLNTITTERDDLQKRVKELEAQPTAPKGVLRAVEKGQDISEGESVEVEPIRKNDGSVDDELTAIKSARSKPITLF